MVKAQKNPHFNAWLLSTLASLAGGHAWAQPGADSCSPKNIIANVLKSNLLKVPARFDTYYADTLKSLEAMRNEQTGLIRDKILVERQADGSAHIKVINNNTSATNIGLDMINQIAALAEAPNDPVATKNLTRTLAALKRVPYHKDTGLFYSWYSTDKDLTALSVDVSSIDNAHLALALWTVKETFPNTAWAKSAGALLGRMDFSAFYDKSTGLMGGNLKHENGKWDLEPYRFANLGSEARSSYTVPWALGLLKNINDPDFVARSTKALTAEVYKWNDKGVTKPILRTWDGGAFQLLLPKLLLNEEKFSPQLAQSFKNYADYIQSEGARQNYPVPAAFSASNFGVDGSDAFKDVPSYVGKSGSPDLVSTSHNELRDPEHRSIWDAVFTPHAALIASTADPAMFAQTFAKLENIGSGVAKLYQPGLGFMDGYHVKGPYKGRVVPVQLSLDQGMIAMAFNQMKSPDGLSPSARALMNDSAAFERLQMFYRLIDQKLAQLTAPVK